MRTAIVAGRLDDYAVAARAAWQAPEDQV